MYTLITLQEFHWNKHFDHNNMKLLQLVCLLLDYTFHLLLLDYTFHPKSTIFNLSLITSTCLVLNNLPHLLVWIYDASLLYKFFWYQSFGMYHSFKGPSKLLIIRINETYESFKVQIPTTKGFSIEDWLQKANTSPDK